MKATIESIYKMEFENLIALSISVTVTQKSEWVWKQELDS